ncbi:glycosyltransferase family 4 protein [Ferrovibrio sp.]|uniref:glycosyltransferase family 4 protein n=1 Tax=Ferrovibrio sp. TaxID=1917215 RepID=UPI000CC340A9|nr:glycosyltransferase family 4 protein [Ferrovibrio sp.]PJI43538.1 MAG: glycosyl transferase family 1 [Ferrovibrio sp.]
MRIGFYAPLKPSDHPAPSGDRRVARLFIAALRGLGHEVVLLSDLRSYNRDGDAAREAATADAAAAEIEILAAAWQKNPAEKPDLLFTYHVYHKAVDYIGPALKQRFGLPYVIAEASDAPRRREGTWATGYAQAARAITAADLLLAVTRHDIPGLVGRAGEARVRYFAPFIDPDPFTAALALREQHRIALAARFGLPADKAWLLAVGMMRDGDKLASFRRLAETLPLLHGTNWHCIVVGDGPAREMVAAAFKPQQGLVTLTGQMEPDQLAALYAASDLYVWPAVNEAYGMALLEAQAAGLPVLSVRTRGVPDIVEHGITGWLTPDDAPATMANAISDLLAEQDQRRRMAAAAPVRVRQELSVAAAQARLKVLFAELELPA